MSAAKALIVAVFLAFPATAWAAAPDAPPAEAGQPCRGDDQAFAARAESLIAAGIAALRGRAAPAAPPLQPDPQLAAIARLRSCDMAEGLAPFSHTDARGHFIAGDMVRARFGRFGITGENIMKMGAVVTLDQRSFGPEEFGRAALQAWSKSPEHRANILNPRYRFSGIGVAKLGDEAVATEVFHGPALRRDR